MELSKSFGQSYGIIAQIFIMIYFDSTSFSSKVILIPRLRLYLCKFSIYDLLLLNCNQLRYPSVYRRALCPLISRQTFPDKTKLRYIIGPNHY